LRLNVSDEEQGDTRSFGGHGVWGLLNRPPKRVCELCLGLCAFCPIAYGSQARGVHQPGSAGRYIGSAPPRSSNTPNAPARASLPDKPASAGPNSKPPGTETKRKVEGALTVAAIAAIIVQASRDQYHAGAGPALALMTPRGMAARAAGAARIPDRAELRRYAIRAT
jgi:hypothetical protein